MKTLLFFSSIAILFSGCAANKLSEKTQNEKVSLIPNISKSPNIKISANNILFETTQLNKVFLSSVSDIVIPLVSDITIKQIKKAIDKNAEKFTASYSTILVRDDFYVDIADDTHLNMDSFTFKRTIAEGTALEARFTPEVSFDNQFMRLKLTDVIVNYTKAKLKENDNDIDLDFTIGIVSKYSENGNSKNFEAKDMSVKVQSVKLGEKLIMPENATTEWFQIVPRSSKNNKFIGKGNYMLTIHAKEYDNYGERVKEIAKTYDENQEQLVNLLKTLLEKKKE